MSLKTLKKILPIVGIFIFIYIVYSIGIDNLINALSPIKPIYIFLFIFLWIPPALVSVLMWFILLKKHKINVSFLYLFKVNLIGNYYGLITPGSVGWFVVPFYLQKESKEPIEKCISNVLINEALHSLALIVIALIGVVLLASYFAFLLPIVMILFLILFVLIFVFFAEKRGKKALKFLLKLFTPGRFKDKIDARVDLIYEDFPKVRDFILPAVLGFIHWIFYFSVAYIVVILLEIDIPFLYFILIYPIGVIVSSIPLTVGGLGIREGTLVSLFRIFSIAPEKIVALSLIYSILISWIMPAAFGAFFAITDIKKDDLDKEAVK